jgi:hypothetical protein
LAVAATGLVLLAARHPTADLRLMTHSAGDPAPARFQAALDFGLVGVSVLYTWSRELR